MQSIHLPTSTDQLGDQLLRHMRFVAAMDVEKERRINRPYSTQSLFFATFDKEAELKRLFNLAIALGEGVKTLEFA